MFAHQVIESIMTWDQYKTSLFGGKKYWDKIVSNIQDSVKFSLGNAGPVESMGHKYIGEEKAFHGDLGGVRLPFKKMWLDYDRYGLYDTDNTYKDQPWRKQNPKSSKRAILSLGLFDDVFLCYIFNFFDDRKIWDISVVADIIFVDTTLGKHKHKDMILDWLKKTHMDCHIPDIAQTIPVPLTMMDTKTIAQYHIENGDEIATLNQTLLLLSCKNIGTETIEAPIALNKKRIQKGKQPLFTYKTLVIKPTGKKQESIPKHLWENRIHLQRGHFKTYTDEKPLFGKYTGRYWWQPSVRGQNTDGVVMKDYLVKNE